MAGLLRPRALVPVLGIAALCAPLALAAGAWRSGNPPTLQSAQVDGKRRLVVTYTAPGGSSAKPSGKLVTTVTLHGDGKISYKTPSGTVTRDVSSGPLPLYDMESLLTGSRALELAVEEGRVVVGPHSRLRMRDRSGRFDLLSTSGEVLSKEYAGSAWFSGRNYVIVATSSQVRPIGKASFTIQTSIKGGDLVQAYQGKVEVKAAKKELVLTAGFQTFVPFRSTPAPAKKFKPPAKKFWQ